MGGLRFMRRWGCLRRDLNWDISGCFQKTWLNRRMSTTTNRPWAISKKVIQKCGNCISRFIDESITSCLAKLLVMRGVAEIFLAHGMTLHLCAQTERMFLIWRKESLLR